MENNIDHESFKDASPMEIPDDNSDKATREDIEFAERISSHKLREKIKLKITPHLGFVAISLIYFVSITLFLLFFTIIWHRVFPLHWRWLMHFEDIKRLEVIVFSGAVSSLLTSVLSKLGK